jgi:DNA replication protein DnaC
MGDVTRLSELVLQEAPKLAAEPAREWDSQACEYLPAGTLAARKARKDRYAREERWHACGCPVSDDVDVALRAGNLARTEALETLETWMGAREKPWIVLSGPTGCGKSVAVAKVLWDGGGRFVRSDELVRLFSSMFGEQYEQQQKLRDTGRLVIDDVGGELDATRMLPALLDLLDARKSARGTPTIVTTNLSKKEFAARYANERLMSRMAESVHWAAVGGNDLRRAK